MIIGNGVIANSMVKIDSDELLIFASGVSNSKNIDINKFNREKKLLIETIKNNKNKKLIYFSSISSYIENKLYSKHKKNSENIIKSKLKDYIVVRLPQILGKNGNKNNIINFFFDRINNNKKIDIIDTYRSIIDIEDLVKIVNYLVELKYNGIISINYIEKIKVLDIINIIEKIKNKSFIINSTKKQNINIDNNSEFVEKMFCDLSINKKNYNEKIINKYVIYK